MSITVKQGLSGQYFSSNIPDVELSISGYRLAATIEVDGQTIYSEHLFPVATAISLSELGDLLTPYARQRLVASVTVSLEEQFADTTQPTTATMQFSVVYCEADIPTSCDDFCAHHYLSLLLGTKITALGRLEYLHYLGTEPTVATARYLDGTSKQFTVAAVGGNDRYTTVDVSPSGFTEEGKTLMEYQVTTGQRTQLFRLDQQRPDCAPVLIFVNSFGCEELFYCTGTATKAPTFKRESAFIMGRQTNYKITETRTFKADTGCLNEDMADWFSDLMRSPYVRLVTFKGGHPTIGREIVITESKSEQTNDIDEIPRFTFSYNYAQRNHNVLELERQGRIFDNTFDFTFS